MKHYYLRDKGQFITFVAVALIILGLLIGIAIDGGRAYLLRSRIFKLVDPASLAGASAMVGANDQAEAIALATAAACDIVRVNGFFPDTGPGACPPEVTVTIEDVATADGVVQKGVKVAANQDMFTSFMRLGSFVGCGDICEHVTVSASAVAVPDTLVDVVVVHDDTKSMRDGPPSCNFEQTNDCPIKLAREGAEAFVNLLISDDGSSNAQIALVPFRGCYNTDGAGNCVDSDDEIVSLTNNKATLAGNRGIRLPDQSSPDTGTGIQGLWAQGGSNTNVCLGIHRGREILFGSGSRFLARKVMVLLTDAENTRLNPGVPECAAGSTNQVDVKTNDKASAIKGAPDNVEIYVLGYGVSGGANPSLCNESAINGGNDRNLAKCIASSKAGTNDHYFEAATESEIPTLFEAIAEAILRKLHLAA